MTTEKLLAYYPMTAFGGIAVLDIKYGVDDKVLTAWYHDGAFSGKGWGKVYTNHAGESYFKKSGVRYYLHNFITNKEVN